MNLSKLTFGQLYKLQHQVTLMRVTRAYHTALRNRWAEANESKYFRKYEWESVTAAEERFPTFCEPWQKLIAFLRSRELRIALKRAAFATQPRIVTGMWTDFRVIPVMKCDGPDAILYERMKAVAYVRAVCISNFCHRHGIPAYVAWQPGNKWQQCIVKIETDELNAALLTWKPGTLWKTLVKECEIFGFDAHTVFWWAPHDITPHQRLNPANRPVNSPDVLEVVAEMLEPVS